MRWPSMTRCRNSATTSASNTRAPRSERAATSSFPCSCPPPLRPTTARRWRSGAASGSRARTCRWYVRSRLSPICCGASETPALRLRSRRSQRRMAERVSRHRRNNRSGRRYDLVGGCREIQAVSRHLRGSAEKARYHRRRGHRDRRHALRCFGGRQSRHRSDRSALGRLHRGFAAGSRLRRGGARTGCAVCPT